jgi:AraC-like DNA-binding protein
MQLPPQPLLEKVPFAGPSSVAVREFHLKAFTYPWHQHLEVELTWILKGSGLRYVGDSVEPFHEGDFCLLGSNLPHMWISPESPRPRGVRSLVVQFDPQHWGGYLQLPEMSRIRDLFERASRGLRFGSKTAERLRAKILERTSPLFRFTALLEILEELSSSRDAEPISLAPWPRDMRSRNDPRISKVLEYVVAHAGEPVSQESAARLVRLSPAAFSRFFRRAMGKTFQSYMTDLRLSEACRQLLETDRTISEIAYASGFGNLSNFNRSFRLARGMPPGEFRRRARGMD